MNQPEFWIIDDDTLYVRELVKALSAELAEFKVVKFFTSRPVLEALAGDSAMRPAGAIVDMMLARDEWDNPMDWPVDANPAKNGIEIVKELLTRGISTSQIGVITAVVEPAHLAPLFDAGFDKNHLLIKPAEVNEIRQLVRRITQSYQRATASGRSA